MIYREPPQAHASSHSLVRSVMGAQSIPKVVLTAAICKLSETGRLVLSLHYVEGLGLEEIAVVLGHELAEVERVHAAALTQLYASRPLRVKAMARDSDNAEIRPSRSIFE